MANKYSAEIISKISKMEDLVEVKNYDLKEKYDEFVLDCYKGDDDAFLEGYIYEKIKNMKNTNNTNVTLFIVRINNPTYKLNIENGINQCVQTRKIKQNIRDEYANKIEGYFFDNLIHMTDNDEEFQRVLKILPLYDQYIINEEKI